MREREFEKARARIDRIGEVGKEAMQQQGRCRHEKQKREEKKREPNERIGSGGEDGQGARLDPSGWAFSAAHRGRSKYRRIAARRSCGLRHRRRAGRCVRSRASSRAPPSALREGKIAEPAALSPCRHGRLPTSMSRASAAGLRRRRRDFARNHLAGARSRSAGLPICTMRPLFITAISVPSRKASSMSCVTKTMVLPLCRWMCRNSCCSACADQGIERTERLVHQHDVGVGGERAGDADALLLAARELMRIARDERRIELHERERALRPARRSGFAASRGGAAQPRYCRRSSNAETDRPIG